MEPPDDGDRDDADRDDAERAASTPTDERPSDLRAKDVLGHSGEELAAIERTLSPTELADLERWFQRPSAAFLEAKADGDGDASDGHGTEAEQIERILDREFKERQKAIAAACAAVEPEMIALCERHARNASRHREIEPPKGTFDLSIVSLRVPTEEESASIADSRSYERDREVEAALEVSVPQAILRDLYRPIEEFPLAYVRPEPDDDEPVYDAHVAVIAALGWRPERPSWDRMVETGRDARRRFEEARSVPWTEVEAILEERRKSQ